MSKTKLTASDWEVVKDAPFWVNQALAKADGRVSFLTKRREGQAFEKALAEYKTSNALIKDIIADDTDAAKGMDKASQADAEKALGRIAAIVDEKLGADDLAALKDFLLKIGNAVASSSREGGMGIAKTVSEKEAAALTGIERAMTVSAPHAAAPIAGQPKPAAAPSATPKPAPAPAKRDDEAMEKENAAKREEAQAREDAAKREEAARKQAEARERLENARKEAMAKAEAKEKAEAEA